MSRCHVFKNSSNGLIYYGRRSLTGDVNLKAFVLAYPTKDIVAAAKATVQARSTPTQPVTTSSPVRLQDLEAVMEDDDYNL